MITQNKTTQDMITPEMALQFLKEGNSRFLHNTSFERDYNGDINLKDNSLL